MRQENRTTEIVPFAEKLKGLRALLEGQRARIAAVLPRHLTAERVLRIALTEVQRTPALLDCVPGSVVGCVVQASELGLEVGSTLGHAYLVPFYDGKIQRKRCTLIVGYKGLAQLARNTGEIAKVSWGVVREGDEFRWQKGTEEFLRHIPRLTDPEEPAVAYWAAVRLTNGEAMFEVLSRAQVVATRERSKAREGGPWVTDFDAMGLKTALRRLLKLAPASTEKERLVQAAVTTDEASERGEPSLAEQVMADAEQGAMDALVAQVRVENEKAEPAAADTPAAPATEPGPAEPGAAAVGKAVVRTGDAEQPSTAETRTERLRRLATSLKGMKVVASQREGVELLGQVMSVEGVATDPNTTDGVLLTAAMRMKGMTGAGMAAQQALVEAPGFTARGDATPAEPTTIPPALIEECRAARGLLTEATVLKLQQQHPTRNASVKAALAYLDALHRAADAQIEDGERGALAGA